MINLLPLEEKRQLQAARTNTLLIRYNFALLIAAGFLGVAMAIVFFYLGATKAAAEQTVSENELRARNYATVAAEAETFRSNLSIAKQILSNEVTYSKVILAIAKLMPPGTILESLSLDAATFGTPTVLVAQAKSYQNALALKDSFQASPLFSDVHFQSITSEGSGSYPFKISLSITFKKEAAK